MITKRTDPESPLGAAIRSGIDSAVQSGAQRQSVAQTRIEDLAAEPARTVFYALAVTDAALDADLAAREAILRKLAALSDQRRVFVFIVGAADVLPQRGDRMIVTNNPAAEVARLGLIARNVVACVAGWNDPSIAALLAPKPRTPAIAGTVFSVIPTELQGEYDATLLPLATDTGPLLYAAAVDHILGTATFAPRVNIRHDAEILRSGDIRIEMLPLEENARSNFRTAMKYLGDMDPRLGKPEESPLDHRSGAVFFTPKEWLLLEADQNRDEVTNELYEYFNAPLPDYWEEDRPCKKRILYTPTKILLRGEQYYTNMRRISPFIRLTSMWDELEVIKELKSHISETEALFHNESTTEWKLVLAFTDQIRHIALVTFAYVHGAASFQPPIRPPKGADALAACQAAIRKTWGDLNRGVHGFLRYAIDAYYSCIFRKAQQTRDALTKAFNAWDGVAKALRDRTRELQTDHTTHIPVGDFVRQWREADHPGENILVALQALHDVGDASVDVVGIGWGGIELPLVYDFLARTAKDKTGPTIHIAQWSHYRSPERPPLWYHFPVHNDDELDVRGRRVVLFDDNTLTGITLQRIRDELLLRGAARVDMYLTRYSDERRWGHMQMPDHGVIDPEILGNSVGGYLGPTPFARSWSRKAKDYRSAIGVFSMARRRILECIYNNSTVELYQREGF